MRKPWAPSTLQPEAPSALQPEAPSAAARLQDQTLAPPPPPPDIITLVDVLAQADSDALVAAGTYLAIIFASLVVIQYITGRLYAATFQQWGNAGGAGSRMLSRTGSAIDFGLVCLRLVPRGLSLLILLATLLTVISPFLTLHSLTPVFYDLFAQCVVFLPCFSLLLMLVHDLALLLKGVPPTHQRPVHALALMLMPLLIDATFNGSIADVLYLAAWPTVALSGYFDAWWAVIVIPFTIAALLLWLMMRCCGRAVRVASRLVATPSVGGGDIPPLVDLVTVRTATIKSPSDALPTHTLCPFSLPITPPRYFRARACVCVRTASCTAGWGAPYSSCPSPSRPPSPLDSHGFSCRMDSTRA